MALTFYIHAATTADSLLAAVRAALPTARAGQPSGTNTHVLVGDHVWIAIGNRRDTTSTPAGEIDYAAYCCVRLDKFSRGEAMEEALRCVQSTLDTTNADLALIYLCEIVLLTRRGGVARAYRYHDENDFWDVHDLPRSSGSSIPLETIERGINDDDSDDSVGA